MNKPKSETESKPRRKRKTKAPAKAKLYGVEHKAIRAELRKVRLQAGLSQGELSAAFGQYQSFASLAEREGGTRLDMAEIRHWCVLCRTDLITFATAVEARLSGVGPLTYNAKRTTVKS